MPRMTDVRGTGVAAVVVAAVVLLAGGCSSGDGGAGKASASPSPSVDRAGEFIAAAQGLEFTSRHPSNTELLVFPPKWCAGLGQGHSVSYLFNQADLYPVGDDWGMVKQDADDLLVDGVRSFCPKYLPDVEKELRAGGDY